MFYTILADLLVTFHAAYVGYVVIGELLILLGLALRWQWVRNPWFRMTHLAAIAIVGLEAVFKMDCPLTVWERNCRSLAGQQASELSFIGRLFNDLLFYPIPEDHWIFPTLHIGFAIVVLVTFVLAPPRWRHSTSHAPVAA
jgi:hypothetical protein